MSGYKISNQVSFIFLALDKKFCLINLFCIKLYNIKLRKMVVKHEEIDFPLLARCPPDWFTSEDHGQFFFL